MPAAKQPASRGRPSKDIAHKFRQISVYLPPDLVDDIDRLANQQRWDTGHYTHRTDMIRFLLRKGLESVQGESRGTRRKR